jgi:hypothetical protein
VPHAHAVAEHDLATGREADERRDRPVRAATAEQRLLELLVRPVERSVVPVEAAARLRDAEQQREQHALERFVAEESRGGLRAHVLHRELCVLPVLELARPRFDEVANERTVLVQGRAPTRSVLLERERQLRVLRREHVERAEAEAAKRAVERWSASGHGPWTYALGLPFPA